jgi:hypothetical protein
MDSRFYTRALFAAGWLAFAGLLPGACRDIPPEPEALERFAPENRPAEPQSYPSLGRVPDRPEDLPTQEERDAMREELERDRDALRGGPAERSGPDLLPEETAAPSPEPVPDETTPRDSVPNPAIPDSVTP